MGHLTRCRQSALVIRVPSCTSRWPVGPSSTTSDFWYFSIVHIPFLFLYPSHSLTIASFLTLFSSPSLSFSQESDECQWELISGTRLPFSPISDAFAWTKMQICMQAFLWGYLRLNSFSFNIKVQLYRTFYVTKQHLFLWHNLRLPSRGCF